MVHHNDGIQEIIDLSETMRINKISQEKKGPNTRNATPGDFINDVLIKTHYIKVGKPPGIGYNPDVKRFSAHKARAVKLTTYSFPLFVIHKLSDTSPLLKNKKSDEENMKSGFDAPL
jgi:hypothetical protein